MNSYVQGRVEGAKGDTWIKKRRPCLIATQAALLNAEIALFERQKQGA